MPRYARSRDRFAPKCNAGYLYYVRLRTEFGLFYKVGFTTLASAEDRFAFNGGGDDKLIDASLLFIYLDNAYLVEQQVHGVFSSQRAFGKYGNYAYLPLADNGQSELYAHDVLKLDPEFREQQATQSKRNVKTEHARQRNSHPLMIWLDAKGIEQLAKIAHVLTFPVVYPVLRLLRYLIKDNIATFSKLLDQRRREEVKLLAFLAAEKRRQILGSVLMFRRDR